MQLFELVFSPTGGTRDIGIVFVIRQATIEYFNLGVRPIFRETYSVNGGQAAPKGYRITDACIGCGRWWTAKITLC